MLLVIIMFDGVVQRRCRSYGRVRDAEYRPGADEVRGRRRHVPDGQDAVHSATGHDPD